MQAAGTYLESTAQEYDIASPKQDSTKNDNALSLRKQIFSGTVPQRPGSFDSADMDADPAQKNKIYYPTFMDYLSSDSHTDYIQYENSKYTRGDKVLSVNSRARDPMYQLMEIGGTGEKLLPGFAATISGESGAHNAILNSGDIYDLYPGNVSLPSDENLNIRFKVMAMRDGNNWKFPYVSLGDGFSVVIATGTTENITYTVNSNLKLVPNKISSYWNHLDLIETNNGLAYGFSFYNSGTTISVGTVVTVKIEGKYVDSTKVASKTFRFQVEGVPFLTNLVSENAAPNDTNNEKFDSGNKNQLYGWSAAGGGDINGDGFPDLVVTDPYYLYDTSGTKATSGRAYVYFGGPDKILDNTKKLPTPDIIIENPSQNSTSIVSKEFAYKAKLGDINGDGYADIILGWPTYSNNADNINKGRLLIYYGGAQLQGGDLMMNVYYDKSSSTIITERNILKMVTPSIILENDIDIYDTTGGNPLADPLLGAVFDVGDLNNDGYADILAKVGNESNYEKNYVYVISGKTLSAETNPQLLRTSKTKSLQSFVFEGNTLHADTLSDVAIVGDFDRDGFQDFAISYPNSGGVGNFSYPNVRVFRGGFTTNGGVVKSYAYASPYVILEDKSSSRGYFGISVAGAGDINGDRYGDIIVGRMTNDDAPGKALIFLGRGGLTPGQKISYDGNEPSNSYPGIVAINEPREILYTGATQFGLKVAGVGDLDNDGYDDVMIGAPLDGESQSGAVYFIMGNGSLPPDSIIGEDNLRQYVLAGRRPNAHYGREIVSLGDFAQNGHNSVLISAPGYAGNALFSGFSSMLSLKNSVSVHNVDIFSSAYSVDNSRPQVLFSQLNPWPDTVAWDEADTLNIVVFDKGGSGLEFNSLSIDFVEPNDNTRTIAGGSLLQSSMELMNAANESVLGSSFELQKFWAAAGNYNVATTNFLENYSNSLKGYYASNNPFNHKITNIKDSYAGKDLYIYEANPRFIGLNFTHTSKILQDGSDYVLRLRFSDRGDGTIFSGSDANRQTTLTLNVMTNEELFASLNVNADVVSGSYTKILDLNGDGFPEFVKGDAGNGRVYLYWGTGRQTFNDNEDTTQYEDENRTVITFDGVTFTDSNGSTTKMSIASAKMMINGDLKNTLFILGQNGLCYLMEDKDLRNTRKIQLNENNEVDASVFNKGVNGGVTFTGSGDLMVLKAQEAVSPDWLVITNGDANGKYTGRLLKGGISGEHVTQIFKNKDNTAIGVMSAGHLIAKKSHQQLIVGNAEKDEVYIYDLSSLGKSTEDNTYIAPIIITNKNMPGAKFGSSLATGYFNSALGPDGNPSTEETLQNLAVGAPGAKINGNDVGTGMVVVFDFNKKSLANDDVFGFAQSGSYVLYGEQASSNFGTSLASVKYYGSPAHQELWNEGGTKENEVFYDDADDLIVGAPLFKIEGSSGSGKVYIYRGSTDNFSLKATSGYVNRKVNKLGASLANVGDIFGYQSDLIAMSGAEGSQNKIYLLRSNKIMDTTPPLLETLSPADRSYEMSLTQNISFTVSDVSGINHNRLDIIRVFSDDRAPEVIVEAGKVLNTDKYVLEASPSVNLARRVVYTLRLNEEKGTQWKNGELVRLSIKVGDGRMRYATQGGRLTRVSAPLFTSFELGFITQFKQNTEITETEIIGQNTNSYFGSTVAYAGDVNKDGFADFIVGEYGSNDYGWMSGKAYLFLGSNDLTKMTKPAASFSLRLSGVSGVTSPSTKLGWRVAPAGDMNGDGYDDVAIVAQNASIDGGEVFILFGNPDPRMDIGNENDRIRSSFIESIVWDDNYLNFRAMSIKAAQLGDGFGLGIHGGGDINGDGYDDLVIGAPYYDDGAATDTGRVYVIFGKPDLQDVYARNSYKYSSVREVYVGPLKLEATATGVKIVEHDLLGTPPADAQYFDRRPVGMIPNTHKQNYDLFGYTVLTGLNLNGDYNQIVKYNGMVATTINVPLSEILITALGQDDSKGAVHIYTGDAGQYKVQDTAKTLHGESAGDKFGFSLASLGDISADDNLGIDLSTGKAWSTGSAPLVGQDFLVGAPSSKGSPSDLSLNPDTGAVYLYIAQPKHISDFEVSPSLTVYGQCSGDQFGYAVSNVGNINNDTYGNNDFAVGAPFFDNGQTANTGRVYIYGTNLKNINESFGDTVPAKYQVVLSSYPEQIGTGKRAYEFFGAAISYLGDIDSDFSPEYIVGAPGYFSGNPIDNNGVGASIKGNIGRVYLYTNPDTVPPFVYEPMVDIYMKPYPGDTLAELATPQKRNKDVTINGAVTRTVEEYLVYNRPITFRIYDDRAVKLDSVLAEVEAEYSDFSSNSIKKETRKYNFVPAVTGVRYYTYVNRKNVDYFLNLANNYYHDATYNVRIYASDIYPNNMEYYYGHPGTDLQDGYRWYYDKWGSGTKTIDDQLYDVRRDPAPLSAFTPGYQDNLRTKESHNIKPYFEFSFHTTPNPIGAPEAQLILETDVDYNNNLSSTHNTSKFFGENSKLIATFKDASGLKSGKITFSSDAVSLNVATMDNEAINKEFSLSGETKKSHPEWMDFRLAIPLTDGTFTLTVEAEDTDGHEMEPKSEVYIVDVAPPTLTAIAPVSGSTSVSDDARIVLRLSDAGTGLDILSPTNNGLDLHRIQIEIASTSNGTHTPWQAVSLNNLEIVSVNYINDGRQVFGPQSMDIALLNYRFTYLDQVAVRVRVSDNAGHVLEDSYSYQVSPDYRPPSIPYGEEPTLMEGEYTDGPLTISLNAVDDIKGDGVTHVLVSVFEKDGLLTTNIGLSDSPTYNAASAPSLSYQIKLPLVPTGNSPTMNSWQIMLSIVGLPTQEDGAAYAKPTVNADLLIKVLFLDKEGNVSDYNASPTLSTILDVSSATGGPSMPTIRINYNGSSKVLPADLMPKHFNKEHPTAELYVYAKDTMVSPDHKARYNDFRDDIDNQSRPLAVVISGVKVDDAGNETRVTLNGPGSEHPADRFLPYRNENGVASAYSILDDYTGRSMRIIPEFDVSKYGEGRVDLYINFADDDPGIHLNQQNKSDNRAIYDDQGIQQNTIYKYLFEEDAALWTAIDARQPWNNTHPLNDLEGKTYPHLNVLNINKKYINPTLNAVNYAARTAKLTIYYDNTPPEIKGLQAFGGRARGAERNADTGSEYMAYSYSRNPQYLQFKLNYRDTLTNNAQTATYNMPVDAVYYQVIAVSKNANDNRNLVESGGDAKMIYVGVRGAESFIDGHWSYKPELHHSAAYLAYDGETELDAGWIPAISPDSEAIVTSSGEVSWNLSEHYLNVDSGTNEKVSYNAKEFVTENFNTYTFVSTNIHNWTRLDVSRLQYNENYDEAGYSWDASVNALDVEIPVKVSTENRYYIRVVIKDKAGNYSPIQNSNYVYIEGSAQEDYPSAPKFNFSDKGLALNRNRFDIDFNDYDAGLYTLRAAVKGTKNNTNYQDIKLDPYIWEEIQYEYYEINGMEGKDFIQEVTHNWKVNQQDWESLPDGEYRLGFYIVDAVGNTFFSDMGNGVLLDFTKDTTPPDIDSALSSSPNGLYLFQGQRYTNDTDISLNVNMSEKEHAFILTDVPWYEILSVKTDVPSENIFARDDLRFVRDFSFEYAGEQSLDKPLSMWLATASETMTPELEDETKSTINIVMIDAFSPTPVGNYYTSKSVMGANGNYALAVRFDVSGNLDSANKIESNGYREYVWPGLFVTFNADEKYDNYTVGVLLNTEEILGDQVNQPLAFPDYTHNGDTRVLLGAPGTEVSSGNSGYFGLVVEAGKPEEYGDSTGPIKGDSKKKLDMTSIKEGTRIREVGETHLRTFGTGWTLITANIQVPKDFVNKTVTISIRLLDEHANTNKEYSPYADSSEFKVSDVFSYGNGLKNYPYSLPRSNMRLHGALLVDTIYVIPGVSVNPSIYVSGNMNVGGYAMNFPALPNSDNDYKIIAYDRLGNVSTQNESVIVDLTPPTWQAEVIVTRHEEAKGDDYDGRYVAYYQKPAVTSYGPSAQLMRNALETEGVTDSYSYIPGGRLYTNAYKDGKVYLSAHFQAQEDCTPIDRYTIRAYRLATGNIAEGNMGEWESTGMNSVFPANNRTVLKSLRYDVNVDSFVPGVWAGDAVRLGASATNILNLEASENEKWVYTEPVWIDVDAPLLAYAIAPGRTATVDMVDGGVTTNDSGWYEGPIDVTINALDVLVIGRSAEGPIWVPGGVGVSTIHLITNNGEEYVYHVSDDDPDYWEQPGNPTSNRVTRNKTITFQLTAEGPNAFKVWATDKFGLTSNVVERSGLNIDTSAPRVQFVRTDSLLSKQTTDLANPNWLREDVGFAIKFSDGLGTGSRELHWSLNGRAQSALGLNTEPLGMSGYVNYIPRGTSTQNTLAIREGVVRGFVPMLSLGLSAAEKSALVEGNYGVLGYIPGEAWKDYYAWNPENIDTPTFVNEGELYKLLNNELKLANPDRVVNAWRFNTNADGDSGSRELYYQVLETDPFKITKDGYHTVSAYTVDKFGNTSNVDTLEYFTIDRGKPDMQIDLGGSFQSQWYVGGYLGGPTDNANHVLMNSNGIVVKAQVGDTFRDPVLVTRNFYPGKVKIPHYMENLTVKAVGSGVKKIEIGIGTSEQDLRIKERIISPAERVLTRFGFSVNKGYGTDDDLQDMENFIITRNGINMITYQVFDYAGNYSEKTFSRSDPQWNEILGSYVYDGDNGVIRGIKVDTLPPYAVSLNIFPFDDFVTVSNKAVAVDGAYTDTRPDLPDYPLYTNKRDVTVWFAGKDDGIGVRYGYFTASENAISSANGVRSNEGNPSVFLEVDKWVELTKDHNYYMQSAPDPVSKEQGVLDYANIMKIWLGPENDTQQGTRNIVLQVADDFGLDYFVSASAVEQTVTFAASAEANTAFFGVNYLLDLSATGANDLKQETYVSVNEELLTAIAELVPAEQINNGKFGVRVADGAAPVNVGTAVDLEFFWGGRFDVPSAYQGIAEAKQTNYGGITVNVYRWDERLPGRADHRSVTVNADRIIIYDNLVSASQILGADLPLEGLVYDKYADVSGNMYTGASVLTVNYLHDETDELSGITHIMFGGDVRSVVPANGTTTQSYRAGEWVPYAYRSAHLTNNYVVTLVTPEEEGILTVKVIGVRDRAGNELQADDMHSAVFYYDKEVPQDNLEKRYIIKNDNGMLLYDLHNQNTNLNVNRYFVGAATYNIELNFRGASWYEVLEQRVGFEPLSLVSGSYRTLPNGSSKEWQIVPAFTLSDYNKEDGKKTLIVRLYDRATDKTITADTPYVQVSYTYYVDTKPPVSSISGLDLVDKDKWYIPSVTFNLNVTDNGSAIARIAYRVNNGVTHNYDYVKQTYNDKYDARIVKTPLTAIVSNILINTTGENNKITTWLEDVVGNITVNVIDGIKVNANPPQLVKTFSVPAAQGSVEGETIYVNTSEPEIYITGYGDMESLSLDLAVDGIVNQPNVEFRKSGYYKVKLGSEVNKIYALSITAKDAMSKLDNGPTSTVTVNVALDTGAPSLTVADGFDEEIRIIDDATQIRSNIDNGPIIVGGYASDADVYYVLSGVDGKTFKAQVSGNEWAVVVKDVMAQAGRNTGKFTLQLWAQDKAANKSTPKTYSFSIAKKYILAVGGTVQGLVDIDEIGGGDNGMIDLATAKLSGITYLPELMANKEGITAIARIGVSSNAKISGLGRISALNAADSTTASVVIKYSDEAAAKGKVDNFRIYYLDQTKAEWVLVPGQDGQNINKDNKTVSAQIIGDGLYRIFVTNGFADNLKDVHIYPNPYKGSDGDTSNGEDDDDVKNKVLIENVTKTARVRIYTVSGELVTTLDSFGGYGQSSNSATMYWDLTNSRGARVASGVYIIFITDEEGHKYTGRLTIVR
ncbi:putative integrin alpha [Candidatus Termititenax persephonae]|uniref:Integrin alpha n=1 Tax=Candidatus Termititenax persephonae TaxID=2218525 RepID=A0A388THE5_9BACT|nr:putative integrin alpha [Candidatus Termititenax persephonae]